MLILASLWNELSLSLPPPPTKQNIYHWRCQFSEQGFSQVLVADACRIIPLGVAESQESYFGVHKIFNSLLKGDRHFDHPVQDGLPDTEWNGGGGLTACSVANFIGYALSHYCCITARETASAMNVPSTVLLKGAGALTHIESGTSVCWLHNKLHVWLHHAFFGMLYFPLRQTRKTLTQ